MKKKLDVNKLTYRYENFGGIISSQEPPFLAFVDRDYMRELGLESSPLWDTADESIGILSAPTEVHFAVTNRCSTRCEHCYMDGGDPDPGELDTAAFKSALDVLAGMKVFHIALGGGEALERDDLFEIAAYARQTGLIPNLTVSGAQITEQVARQMTVFGQVNISVDGIDDDYAAYRGKEMFPAADRAFDYLTAAGVPTGINCVIGKKNFAGIEQLFRYAKKKKLNEIEFLRLKPAGRGKSLYLQERSTYEQNIQLTPLLAKWSQKYKITAKIDCSFVPMYCYHRPPVELLEGLATYGCEAGNVLLGARSDGSVSGCSFLENLGISVFDLPAAFGDPGGVFRSLRSWPERAVEPCLSCEYLRICKGGCHGVSQYVSGNFDAPDPDCPFVVEYNPVRTGRR
ncbi:MAG: radical SAM protein, partial [Candidatus Aminicenantes bacterium]|nr:radical SAM protein [Candidatus Aminicenantes bacterium]